jgi:hypothetical protein
VVIARSSGVDLSTGAGLDAALETVETVIDLLAAQPLRAPAPPAGEADVLRLQSLPTGTQILGHRGAVHPQDVANSTPARRTETSHSRAAATSSRAEG